MSYLDMGRDYREQGLRLGGGGAAFAVRLLLVVRSVRLSLDDRVVNEMTFEET